MEKLLNTKPFETKHSFSLPFYTNHGYYSMKRENIYMAHKPIYDIIICNSTKEERYDIF